MRQDTARLEARIRALERRLAKNESRTRDLDNRVREITTIKGRVSVSLPAVEVRVDASSS